MVEVLRDGATGHVDPGAKLPRVRQDALQIEILRLLAIGRRSRRQSVCASHHLLEGSEAELRHVAAYVVGQHEHEVNDVLGRALELLTKNRVLKGKHDGENKLLIYEE